MNASPPPIQALPWLFQAADSSTPTPGNFTTNNSTPASVTTLILSSVVLPLTVLQKILVTGIAGVILFNRIGVTQAYACTAIADDTHGNSQITVSAVGTGFSSFNGTYSFQFVSLFSALPTSDPHSVGQWWSNLGIVTISAG